MSRQADLHRALVGRTIEKVRVDHTTGRRLALLRLSPKRVEDDEPQRTEAEARDRWTDAVVAFDADSYGDAHSVWTNAP